MLNTTLKKRSIIIITVLTMLIFVSILFTMNKKETITEVQVYANEITFDTPEKLDAAADLIIIASPTKEFLEREHKTIFFEDGTVQDYYTSTEVQIEKVIKAPDSFNLQKNDAISIIEPVGIVERSVGKRKLITNHYQELKKNSSYILFLMQNSAGQYALINNNLGKFNLDNTDTLDIGEEKSSKAKEFKNDVLKKYSLN